VDELILNDDEESRVKFGALVNEFSHIIKETAMKYAMKGSAPVSTRALRHQHQYSL